jgi:hypothetical protein
MHGQRPNTITDAEVLSVTTGVDEATAQPVVVLTLRPITGTGWGHVNYSLTVENADALVGRLLAVRDSPLVKPHRLSAANSQCDSDE